MEPVELRLVVLVGRARVGAIGTVAVHRSDDPPSGRHVAVPDVERDRDRGDLLGRNDEVEHPVAPDQQDRGLGPVEPVDGPEEADDASHQVRGDPWQRVVDELRARRQVGDAPDLRLAHPQERALPEIEPVAGDDEGRQGRAFEIGPGLR